MIRSVIITMGLSFTRSLCLISLLHLFIAHCVTASATRGNLYPLASASIPYDSFSRRRSVSARRRRHGSLAFDPPTKSPVPFTDDTRAIILASARSSSGSGSTTSKRRDSSRQNSSTSSRTSISAPSASASSSLQPPTVSYADLSPLGRAVAGTVEIAVSTLTEYVTGFAGGYFLGTVTDVPRLLFRRVEPEARQALMQEASGRMMRMHAKSFRWARNWGGISAAFGCFRVATKVVRGGKEDEWTTILSSMAAGAFFARQEGPAAMLRGAATYGGMMYVLANGFGPPGKGTPVPQDYPIDF